MGLKLGVVKFLSTVGLYIPIATRKGEAYSYATAFLFNANGEYAPALRFLNGSLGYIARNRHHQFEVFELGKTDCWVPTKEQSEVMKGISSMPNELLVFNGTYQASEVFPHNVVRTLERRKKNSLSSNQPVERSVERRVSDSFDTVPPIEHETVQERFSEPEGLWNKVVAGYLREANLLT
jgi:hypothetical protein